MMNDFSIVIILSPLKFVSSVRHQWRLLGRLLFSSWWTIFHLLSSILRWSLLVLFVINEGFFAGPCSHRLLIWAEFWMMAIFVNYSLMLQRGDIFDLKKTFFDRIPLVLLVTNRGIFKGPSEQKASILAKERVKAKSKEQIACIFAWRHRQENSELLI